MDREDFARRITDAQGRMYRVTCGYLRGEQDRLDAISETILKAWQKQAGLREERYFDTWVMRILIRECVNIQRRQRRAVPMAELPEGPARDETALTPLRIALEALPDKLRAVVLLHYMEGYAVADIARILHITKGAVCSRLFRGREQLRNLLKEEIE